VLRIRETYPPDTVLSDAPLSGTFVVQESSPEPLRYLLEARVLGWEGVHRSDTSVAVRSPGSCWIASGYDHMALLSPHTTSLLPSVSPGAFVVDVSSIVTSLWAAGMPGGVVFRIEASVAGPFLTEDAATSLSIRSISASWSSSRVLLAHAGGLTWFDPERRSLEAIPLNHSAPPRLARLAPDEEGAWIWFADDTLAYLPPGGGMPTASWKLPDVAELCPVAGRRCWAGAAEGLFLAGTDGLAEVSGMPVASVAGVSATECWLTSEEGSVQRMSADGSVMAHRELGGYRVCAASEQQVIWVASQDTTLWKLLPDLQIAAQLRLFEPPWAVAPGPVSFQ
jgi:hypothetical protein